ncbi:lecithin retinol acyltransferase family protein [Spirulina sp. CCNP1310]|uniref:lecithin retinol acyltransferase family protein n=1 Tax=Spirulina sp. CCNP1310 TaxID=3110249 RepID=UPI002B21FBD1|nr:lecithin retinol acyltransferase family protein [Spirulina sp. CCNP1310]MEA5419686.1 lecithin retinol acyltransferase family protein [Spirulina sp. CCNP1310]
MARGDQIYVLRELLNLNGVYEHHGIDCGDGTVIHYRKPSEVIERTTLATFSQGQRVRAKTYPTTFIPDVVVDRAFSRLGENRYNLLFNNCEHFATWCKTGVSHSQQIKDFIPWIVKGDPSQLETPVDRALQGTDLQQAKAALDRALGQIKVVWDDVQPRYKRAKNEAQAWGKVAETSLQRHREDLARAALLRKVNYQKEADKLEQELQKLATMTETLLRNSVKLAP